MFAVSLLPPKIRGLILSKTVKAHACQNEKNKMALMQRNLAKGLNGFNLSSVAI
jgi:hypothetical protein